MEHIKNGWAIFCVRETELEADNTNISCKNIFFILFFVKIKIPTIKKTYVFL
jgi:hypothetical protein